MEEKLSYHCCAIPVQFDGVLEHLFVNIKFRAMVEFDGVSLVCMAYSCFFSMYGL
jgi:hypothetical protein